jgi:hypothetical protein
MIIYLIGMILNLILTIVEERSFKEPIWYRIYRYPKSKEVWYSVLDKSMFIFLSWVSYFIYGIMFYISNWKK